MVHISFRVLLVNLFGVVFCRSSLYVREVAGRLPQRYIS